MSGFKYWAFISYSHQDRAWGNWLHRTLETYRVPARLVGRDARDGKIPARLFPVFRDRDELPSSADLGGVINEALAASRYQIVICSPRSANSKWVNEEVRHFKSLGREDRVLCLIVDGEPNSGDARECFAPALRFRVTREGEITSQQAEPIAADAREHADGKQGAKLKLIAGLLGVGFDEIVQREKQRLFWRRVQMVAAAFAFAGVIAGVSQWFLHQRASREREITIDKLVENGRLELLDGHQARAAVFLNEAYKMGDDSVPVRFMLHQALLPVEALTNVRVHHGGTQVYRSAFSPDDKQFVLIVTDDRGTSETAVAKIYDAATGAELMVLPDAPVLPIHVEFLPSVHRLLVSGYADSGFADINKSGAPFTRVWDLEGSHESLKLDGVSGAAGNPASADGRHVIVCGADGLHVRDTTTGSLVATLAAGRQIVAATYSADGKLVAFADAQGNVGLVEATSSKLRNHFAVNSGQIVALTFSPDGQRLVSMSSWGDVRIWDLQRNALQLAFAADPNWTTELKFDQSGTRFVTVGSQGFRVWSTQRGSPLAWIPLAATLYSSATLSPDGDTLVTADYASNTSEAWDIRSQRKLYTLDLHGDGVSSAVFDSKGARLLLASRDGEAELWRMPIEPSWKYESFETLPYSARFSRDGKRVLVGAGDQDGRAMIFDLEKGAITQEFGGHKSLVYEAAFSPDEDRVVTASRDGTAGLWDVVSGKRLATMDQHADEVYRASFSPDGSRIVTSEAPMATTHENIAGLWNARTGERVAMLKHEDRVYAARFDAESKLVVTAGGDAKIKIWDAASGALLRTLSGHGARVYAIDLSSDGRKLVSVAHDHTARIWNPQSGTTDAILDNPAIGLPEAVRLSPDEQTVAIGTQEGTVWLWKPSTNALRALKGHRLEVDGLRFSRDGRLLFSYAWDGVARAWDADKGTELAVVGAHEEQINSLDLDSDAERLLTASWSQLEIRDVASERRSPQEIDRVIRCADPWSLQASSLALVRVALNTYCNRRSAP